MTPGGVVSFRRNSLLKWLINGKTYRMDEFLVVVLRGVKEVWEIYDHEKSMPSHTPP